MNIKKYRQTRATIIFFIGAIILISIFLKIYLLAVISVLTGIFFLSVVRFKTNVVVDEREQDIKEKAANTAYAIFTPTIGLGSFLLLFPSYSGLSVFSKGEFLYLESLGIIFAYLTLFLITLYIISFYFLNKKYGGGQDEE